MGRTILTATILLGVIALVVWSLVEFRADAGTVDGKGEGHEQPKPDVAVESKARASDAASRAELAGRSNSMPDDRAQLRGSVIVLDADGVEQPAENGRFRIIPFDDELDAQGYVEVSGGNWRARVDRTARIRIGSLVVGGRPVALERDRFDVPDPVPSDFSITIRGHWLYPARLRVRDRVTGADLREVAVVRGYRGISTDMYRYPGERSWIRDRADSPLELPVIEEQVEIAYWLRAPGYAWNKVNVLHRSVGERSVFLDKGGELHVRLEGDAVPRDAVVRIRALIGKVDRKLLAKLAPSSAKAVRSPTFDRRLRGERSCVLEGVPPGGYLVEVVQGLWFESPTVYGAALALIEPGQRARVVVRTRQVVRPEIVDVAGVLRLPEAWGTQQIALEFSAILETRKWMDRDVEIPLHEMKALGGGDFRFATKRLVPGTYQAKVKPIEVRARVEIGAGGNSNLLIVAPHPADVAITVVDAETRKPIPGARVSWHTVVPEGVSGYSTETAWLDEEKLVSRFRAPVGKVEISTHPEGYVWKTQKLEVHLGMNPVTIPVSRVCGVEVSLKIGKVAVPWNDECFVELEGKGHDGSTAYWSGNKVAATRPGEYTLTMTKLKGFKKIPPRTVRIPKGKWVPVVVQLEHEKCP